MSKLITALTRKRSERPGCTHSRDELCPCKLAALVAVLTIAYTEAVAR